MFSFFAPDVHPLCLAQNKKHQEIRHNIEIGNGLPDMRTTREVLQALRDAGFSDRGIWDVAEVAAFFNMSNRMASALGLQPNPEYHAMARD